MGKFETEQTSSAEIHDDPFLGRDRAPLLIAAELVIEQFGEKAAPYATERADALYREGDLLVAAAWRRVVPLIDELQRRRRAHWPTWRKTKPRVIRPDCDEFQCRRPLPAIQSSPGDGKVVQGAT